MKVFVEEFEVNVGTIAFGKVIGKFEVGAGFRSELVVESADAGFGADGVVDYILDEADNLRRAPAIAKILVMADSAEMAEDKTVGAFDAATGVDANHGKAMFGAEEAEEFLSDGSSDVGAPIAGDLVIRAVGNEVLEESRSKGRSFVVFGRIDGHKVSKVVDDDIGTDVSVLVGWRTREGVDADAATSVGRLEMLGDGLNGSNRRHTIVGLLADSAGADEFLDDLKVNTVARVHAVEVSLGFGYTAVFTVVNMGLAETLGHIRQDREMIDGAKEQSIPFEGSMAGDVVGSLRIPGGRVGRRGIVSGVGGD